MKRSIIRIASLLIVFTLSLTLFSACTRKENVEQSNNSSVSLEVHTAQIEFYSALVNDLQQQLLKEKEESYISECSYRIEIEKLQKDIEALLKKQQYFATSSDKIQERSFSDQSKKDSAGYFEELSAKSCFEYTVQDGEITVTSYNGDGGKVTIPSFINNIPVTAIGDNAFENTNVTEVILPEGIKSIGWFAFSRCIALNEISVPSSVTSIGYDAFQLCSGDIKISCENDSYAHSYAKSWGIVAELK